MSSSQNNHSHYDKEVKDFIRRNPWLCYFFPWQTDDMTLEVAYRSWIDNLNDWIRKNDPKDPPNSEWYTDADQRAAYCRFCYRNGEKRLLTPIGRDSGLVRLQIGNTNKHFANTQKHHGNISQLYNSTKKDITLAAIQECTVALFLKTPTVPFEFFDQPEWEAYNATISSDESLEVVSKPRVKYPWRRVAQDARRQMETAFEQHWPRAIINLIDGNYIAVTHDGFTQNNTKFGSFTISFFSVDWKWVSIPYSIDHIPGSHSSTVICDYIAQKLKQLNLSDSQFVRQITVDTASNNNALFNRRACFNHVWNTAQQKAFEKVEELKYMWSNGMHPLIKLFTAATNNHDMLLDQLGKMPNARILSMQSYNSTRWLSRQQCSRRLCLLLPAIGHCQKYLEKKKEDKQITQQEKKTLKEMTVALQVMDDLQDFFIAYLRITKAFKKLTLHLQRKKSPIGSTLILFIDETFKKARSLLKTFQSSFKRRQNNQQPNTRKRQKTSSSASASSQATQRDSSRTTTSSPQPILEISFTRKTCEALKKYVDYVEYEFFFRLPICTKNHWNSLKLECDDYLKDSQVRDQTFDLSSKVDLFVQTLLNPYCNVYLANEPELYAFHEKQPLFRVAEKIIEYELYFGKPMPAELMAKGMNAMKKKAKLTSMQRREPQTEANLRIPEFEILNKELFKLRNATQTSTCRANNRETIPLHSGSPSSTTSSPSGNSLQMHAAKLREQDVSQQALTDWLRFRKKVEWDDLENEFLDRTQEATIRDHHVKACEALPEWWHKQTYSPRLTNLARKWLTAMPSAAISESTWSTVGTIYTNLRNKLSTHSLNTLCVLSTCYKTHKDIVERVVLPHISQNFNIDVHTNMDGDMDDDNDIGEQNSSQASSSKNSSIWCNLAGQNLEDLV
mmetsp:Transcript_2265/g.3250  ORF Transcript_2265/g.3250 Transcript_2265/m.3250 type:complete len:902 (+) Transcript_2265:69-2774(+)